MLFVKNFEKHSKTWRIFIATIWMIMISFVAQIAIAGDGPGFIGGCMFFPIYGVIISFIGRDISNSLDIYKKELESGSR